MTYTFRQSEIKRFMRCRRSWNLMYREGWRLPSGEAPSTADTGTMVHAGLAALRREEDPREAVMASYLDLAPMSSSDPDEDSTPLYSEQWYKSFTLADTMVEGYIPWEAEEGITAGQEYLAIEEQMEWEIPASFGPEEATVTVTFKPDLVLRSERQGGGIIISDDKTVATLGQTPEVTDFQLLTYALGWWQNTGEMPIAAQHIMLRRVLRSARAKPPFYGVHSFPLNEQMLLNHKNHLYHVINDMVRVLGRANIATAPALYPNPTKDCSWDCRMLPVCGMMDDGSDWESVLQINYTKEEAPHG